MPVPTPSPESAPLPDTDPYARLLGVTVSEVVDGHARADIIVGPEHLNPNGMGHGGLTYSLAASALAAAANGDEQSGVARTIHLDYLAPSREGDHLTAYAHVIERLPTEDIYEVRVTTAAGAALARVTARLTRRPRRAQGSS